MEDIKLWELDGTQATPLGSNNKLESEQGLEDTLVKNPNLLIDGLALVGRQTPTEGGPLDLLGVDGDGRLVVFELKRGTLSRDAVAQIIDYASDLDTMDLDTLADHISENSGVDGIDEIENFQEWYDTRGFGDLGSLKPLRMFLVGLGADDRTERMVRFLAENSGMDISLLTFHAFDYDGKTILAKQVEVEAHEDPSTRPTRRYKSREERSRQLEETIRDSEVGELFAKVRAMFQENWPRVTEQPGRWGVSLRLPNLTGSGRRRAYGRIDPNKGSVGIIFYPLAIELSENEFTKPLSEIPYETWPPSQNPLKNTNTQIEFLLTAEEWDIHKETLTDLVQSVYTAWENQDQDDGGNQHDESDL